VRLGDRWGAALVGGKRCFVPSSKRRGQTTRFQVCSSDKRLNVEQQPPRLTEFLIRHRDPRLNKVTGAITNILGE
jgi:hypothetical protein